MNRENLTYIVYMINACADRWGRSPSEVYGLLSGAGCIDNYLVRHYDVLHTQGTGCVVNDIEEYLANRGVVV